MIRNGSIFKQIDWILIFLYLICVVLGWLTIYAAGFTTNHASIFDFSQEYGKQFIWIIICIILGLMILFIDARFFLRMAIPIYLTTLLLLILVLLFGREVNGAKAWFGIGGFGIQPSEFTKFSTGLVIAKFLGNITVNRKKFHLGDMVHDGFTFISTLFSFFTNTSGSTLISVTKSILVTLTIIGFPAFLILLQPDTGTSLVFVAFVFVMYREGLLGNFLFFAIFAFIMAVVALIIKSTFFLIPGTGFFLSGPHFIISIFIVTGIILFFVIRKYVLKRFRKKAITKLLTVVMGLSISVWGAQMAFDHLLQPHQQKRIEITLGLKTDSRGAGYNVNQSIVAIGSGGISGKGFKNSTLANERYKHVPMQTTDFIFCLIGEEWGLLGTAFVVILMVVFIVRIIIISERQRSNFTRIYGYGVAGIMFVHFAINISMTIGFAPVIGIPLPFFSYGGSSLIGFTLLLFILIRLDAERKELLR